MSDLDESIRRCVQAAYEAWVGRPEPLRPPHGEPEAPPPAPRPIRFVSWEDLDRYADAATDIDAQVREELARVGGGPRVRRPLHLRHARSRRVA